MCRWICSLLLALLACLPALAQAPAPTPERRTIAVSVLDKDGKAVHGLTADNFRAEFRGQPVKILSATEDSSPRRLAIIVDTSASMRPNLGMMQAVVEDLFLRSGPDHYISLFTAQETLSLQMTVAPDPANREQALRQAEQRLSLRGSSALYDAIAYIARDSGRLGDTICLISDGVDNASNTRAGVIERELARTGARFFMLSLQSFDSRRESRDARRVTRGFAEASGGLIIDLSNVSPKKIEAHMVPVREAVSHLYQLEVEFGVEADKTREWKLEVVGAGGEKLKDVVVAYPRLLVPLSEKKK